MKLFLLAAAAVIATPALAQTMPSTTPSPSGDQMTPPATPPADTSMPAPATQSDTTTAAPAGDQAMPSQPSSTAMPGQPMATDQTQSQSMPAQTTGGDPVGGYQPSAPAMSGPMQPGATVVFQPAASPDQAYPAPAPMAKYPVCKPGQYDDCMQASGSRSGKRMARRRR